jgi:hypothetical protein
MPNPLLAIPAAQAIATGAAAAAGPLMGEAGKAIASVVDPAARAIRTQTKRDIDALQRGKLGLSEAEKRTMLAGTQRALQAQTAGLEANLRRSAAAQGGFGRSGAQQQALGTLAAGQRETMAGATGKVDTLSQDVAQRRFADVMGRLQQQRAEARQTGANIGSAIPAGVTEGAKSYGELYKAYMENVSQEMEASKKLKEANAATTGAVVK